ncbi:MAG TPA: adenosylmethionine decarboxylase [Fimbriimonadaceae bacterium]|nr:adenosylmethionine decarboxylase [Fimbriimonadaceae bacterium]
MSNTLLIVSAAVFAAVVPFTGVARTPWWRRFFDKFKRDAAVLPPAVTNEAGWTLIHCDDPDAFREWLGRDEEGLPYKDGEEPSLGSHLLVELYGCDQDALKLERSVGCAMREAADASLATVVAESFHEFKPYGVSGAVIIQESHYTIHTWPEHGYAAVDLFYCGGTVHVHKAVDVLIERFKPTRLKFLVVRRGIQSEVGRS